MEDYTLYEAIDQLNNGTLSEQDAAHLNRLRSENPTIDQEVVNYTYFTKQVEVTFAHKTFEKQLHTLHNELIGTQEITIPKISKLITMRTRLRKQFAVAATIIALVSLGTLGLLFAYKNSTNNNDYNLLSKKVNDVNIKLNEVTKKINNNTKNAAILASSTGTSFVINEKGYLITNNHVVGNNSNLYVYNEKYGDLTAEVILQDAENDLAIIAITDTTFKALKKIPYNFRNGETSLAQRIYTLGYSRPPGLVYNEGVVSSKAANGSLRNKDNFLLTLQVESGSSGSPILNNNGEIVGIVNARENIENGYAVGVKPQSIKNIISVLNETKNTSANLYNNTRISKLNREQQVTAMKDYIFMVKIK